MRFYQLLFTYYIILKLLFTSYVIGRNIVVVNTNRIINVNIFVIVNKILQRVVNSYYTKQRHRVIILWENGRTTMRVFILCALCKIDKSKLKINILMR